jgi:hypothetical protein
MMQGIVLIAVFIVGTLFGRWIFVETGTSKKDRQATNELSSRVIGEINHLDDYLVANVQNLFAKISELSKLDEKVSARVRGELARFDTTAELEQVRVVANKLDQLPSSIRSELVGANEKRGAEIVIKLDQIFAATQKHKTEIAEMISSANSKHGTSIRAAIVAADSKHETAIRSAIFAATERVRREVANVKFEQFDQFRFDVSETLERMHDQTAGVLRDLPTRIYKALELKQSEPTAAEAEDTSIAIDQQTESVA